MNYILNRPAGPTLQLTKVTRQGVAHAFPSHFPLIENNSEVIEHGAISDREKPHGWGEAGCPQW